MKKLYSLKQTPTLLAFIKTLFALEKVKIKKDIEKTLMLHSRCQCGEKHCGTVTLKKKTPWNRRKENSFHIFDVNKGVVWIHFLKRGYCEIEAIGYEDFPYKDEVDKFFRSSGTLYPKINTRKLKNYFKDCKNDTRNRIDLGELNL